MRWVVVDGLEKHWERARVTAEIESDRSVKAETSNVSALTFDMAPGAEVISGSGKVTVTLDGQTLTVPAALTDGSWRAHFRRAGSQWGIADGHEAKEDSPETP